MAIFGVGLGLQFATMPNVIGAAVPANQTGVANGMNANVRNVGGAIRVALMASIVGAHALPSGLPKESGCRSRRPGLHAGPVSEPCVTPRRHPGRSHRQADPRQGTALQQ